MTTYNQADSHSLMSATLLSIIAISIYSFCALYQGRRLLKPAALPPRHDLLHGAISIALALHGIAAFKLITAGQGIDLGILPMTSLSSWCITTLLLISSLRRPLDNLFALLLPITVLCVALPLIFVGPKVQLEKLNMGVVSHILLSMLAHGALAIGTLQAALLATQEKHLKQRVTKGIIQALPPMQTMENLLFEILWLGFILLSLALITGFLYIEDIFAQHLVHKTGLSMAAWVALAILLWGRYKLGWRSQTAARWTFVVFILLMLAYFGSKFVLEIILQRH
jgi:ABC-type uncharacterized transport system permease subunit